MFPSTANCKFPLFFFDDPCKDIQSKVALGAFIPIFSWPGWPFYLTRERESEYCDQLNPQMFSSESYFKAWEHKSFFLLQNFTPFLSLSWDIFQISSNGWSKCDALQGELLPICLLWGSGEAGQAERWHSKITHISSVHVSKEHTWNLLECYELVKVKTMIQLFWRVPETIKKSGVINTILGTEWFWFLL